MSAPNIQEIIDQTGLTTASEFQAAIFEHVFVQIPLVVSRKTPIALAVQAVAGSGKTTTIVAAANLIPAGVKACFLAFNKPVAVEIDKKLPPHIPGKTLNSLGFGMTIRFVESLLGEGGYNHDQYKTGTLMRKMYSRFELGRYGDDVKFLVGMCKSLGIVPTGYPEVEGANGLDDSDDTLGWLLDNYNRWTNWEDRPTVFRMTRQVLVASLDAVFEKGLCDFDDQKYLPVVLRPGGRRLKGPKFQVIMIDEVQDVNAVDIALIQMCSYPNTLVIGVGDTNQAIYGFRGADTQAVSKFIKAFDAIELPLSITYRCARSIVRVAASIFPGIQAAPNAPEGEVVVHNEYKVDLFSPGDDMIVCRNNAPIVGMAYKLIANKIPVFVAGRDIGRGLISLINKLGAEDVLDLTEKLNKWEEQQIAVIDRDRPDDEAARERIYDKADTIREFVRMNTDNSVESLIEDIEDLFKTAGKGNDDEHNDRYAAGKVVLSTVHKAKGLEANRVFLLDAHLFMPKYVKPGTWQEIQEKNLMYVAVTRPKLYLGYIASKDLVT